MQGVINRKLWLVTPYIFVTRATCFAMRTHTFSRAQGLIRKSNFCLSN